MKIAILTMEFNNNYGGMLQAFALMESLKRLGHEPTLIRLKIKHKYWKLPFSILKRFTQKYILRNKSIDWVLPLWICHKEKKVIEQNMTYFIDTYIQPQTQYAYCEEDIRKYTKDQYDAYIVGSDQIWRPTMYKFIDQAFFGFVKEDKILLSYAASFGVDNWEYTNEQTIRFKKDIQRFRAVSVREDSGVDLCKKHFDIEAEHVVDPTMLLSYETYIQLIKKESPLPIKERLLVYLLDYDSNKQSIVDHISSRKSITPFSVNVKSKLRTDSIENRIYPSVISWLNGFFGSEFVITDSFHGAVFAILFNKPFYVISNKKRGLARMESLLRMFNLENRLIFDTQDIKEDLDINWDEVNSLLEAQKAKAFNFLNTNLK